VSKVVERYLFREELTLYFLSIKEAYFLPAAYWLNEKTLIKDKRQISSREYEETNAIKEKDSINGMKCNLIPRKRHIYRAEMR
jgi:hypothetical protein